jgi:membrane-associated phospholipid phosphatase
VGIDLATASATHELVSAPLDSLGATLSILFSAEIALFLALLISLLLWRQGRGLWSLAPLAILPLVGIEVGMKLIVQQPVVPAKFHRSIYYPFTSVTLSGSFPSGHAMRAGFLCTFLTALTSSRRRIVARLTLCGFVLLMVIVAFTRIYLGDHWLSDVVAGLILGIWT